MKRHFRGFTLIELLVVIAIFAVLISLLLPAVQSAREAARRIQCTNNLKRLALATMNYESTNGVFLPGQMKMTTKPPSGYTLFVNMLPFLEQHPLYNGWNFSSGFDNFCYRRSSSSMTLVEVTLVGGNHVASRAIRRGGPGQWSGGETSCLDAGLAG